MAREIRAGGTVFRMSDRSYELTLEGAALEAARSVRELADELGVPAAPSDQLRVCGDDPSQLVLDQEEGRLQALERAAVAR